MTVGITPRFHSTRHHPVVLFCLFSRHPLAKGPLSPSHHAPIGEEGRKNDRRGFLVTTLSGHLSVALLCCFPALYIFLDLGFLDKVKVIVTSGLQS
jgi:hypothetical protein